MSQLHEQTNELLATGSEEEPRLPVLRPFENLGPRVKKDFTSDTCRDGRLKDRVAAVQHYGTGLAARRTTSDRHEELDGARQRLGYGAARFTNRAVGVSCDDTPPASTRSHAAPTAPRPGMHPSRDALLQATAKALERVLKEMTPKKMVVVEALQRDGVWPAAGSLRVPASTPHRSTTPTASAAGGAARDRRPPGRPRRRRCALRQLLEILRRNWRVRGVGQGDHRLPQAEGTLVRLLGFLARPADRGRDRGPGHHPARLPAAARAARGKPRSLPRRPARAGLRLGRQRDPHHAHHGGRRDPFGATYHGVS